MACTDYFNMVLLLYENIRVVHGFILKCTFLFGLKNCMFRITYYWLDACLKNN